MQRYIYIEGKYSVYSDQYEEIRKLAIEDFFKSNDKLISKYFKNYDDSFDLTYEYNGKKDKFNIKLKNKDFKKLKKEIDDHVKKFVDEQDKKLIKKQTTPDILTKIKRKFANPKQLIAEAIKYKVPVQFRYWSFHSPKKKGSERPPHMRTVQPVVLGKKFTLNGVKTYFRAYLLAHYSYSKDAVFAGDLDANTKMEYWRIYRMDKITDLKILTDFPYKFSIKKHPEYNPNDKWFDKIENKMAESLTANQIEIECDMACKCLDNFKIYHEDDKEEIGFIEEGINYINGTFLRNNPIDIIKENITKYFTGEHNYEDIQE